MYMYVQYLYNTQAVLKCHWLIVKEVTLHILSSVAKILQNLVHVCAVYDLKRF